MPFDLSRDRVQGIHVRSVVMGDARCCVDGALVDNDATGHRPGRTEFPVNRNPAICWCGAEFPQRSSRCGFERVDVAVGRSHVNATFPNGRWEEDGAADEKPAKKASAKKASAKKASAKKASAKNANDGESKS